MIAEQYERRTIYHSPQSPGYTCWTGAWPMADGSLMICFTQATGPVTGREPAPEAVRAKLGWPPPDRPEYDFTGLALAILYFRSWDGGATWQQVGADPFRTPGGQMSQGGGQIGLADGSVLRAVFGFHLPLNPELPQTGFLQRSGDGGATWGVPQVLLDPASVTYRVTRLRFLRDGRLLALGGLARVPSHAVDTWGLTARWEPLLLVSADEGGSWSGPIEVVPAEKAAGWGGEEWDVGELPEGDLLAVFRRRHPEDRTKQVRWQGRLRKQGAIWATAALGPAPFPHSGHPDLLTTREGAILHVATTGIHGTTDGGETWQPVSFPDLPEGYRSHYYPHALQTLDGCILVFAHVGAHDAYGARDQAITMDRFRLVLP